jgi:hypothetical protein
MARQAPCADINGFSLHAAVRCGAHDRQALEQLCRCIARPALADVEEELQPRQRRVERVGRCANVNQVQLEARSLGTFHRRRMPPHSSA